MNEQEREYIADRIARGMEGLPPEIRDLVLAKVDQSPIEAMAWLDAHGARVKQDAAARTVEAAKPENQMTAEELRLAREMRISPDRWVASREALRKGRG